MILTHAEIIYRLTQHFQSKGYATVSERRSASGETPDLFAVPWDGASIMVEVKVSRSDFFRDASKPWRVSPTEGVGQFRYMATPVGMVQPSEVPARFGLIEVDDRVVIVHPASLQESSWRAERSLLVASIVKPKFRRFPLWYRIREWWHRFFGA